MDDGERAAHPTREENRHGGPPSTTARKLVGASENGPRGHSSAWDSHEKKEGTTGILTVVKTRAARRREDGIRAWRLELGFVTAANSVVAWRWERRRAEGYGELYSVDWRGRRAELRRERR
jgi:hypothetical protein